MTSTISFLYAVRLALAGLVLVVYGSVHEIRRHVDSASFDHLFQTAPILKPVLSFPPGIFIAIAGLILLALAIRRLRVLWILRQLHKVPVRFSPDRDPRLMPGSDDPAEEDDYEADEFGPDPAYDTRHPADRYRGNGHYDPRLAGSYR